MWGMTSTVSDYPKTCFPLIGPDFMLARAIIANSSAQAR